MTKKISIEHSIRAIMESKIPTPNERNTGKGPVEIGRDLDIKPKNEFEEIQLEKRKAAKLTMAREEVGDLGEAIRHLDHSTTVHPDGPSTKFADEYIKGVRADYVNGPTEEEANDRSKFNDKYHAKHDAYGASVYTDKNTGEAYQVRRYRDDGVTGIHRVSKLKEEVEPIEELSKRSIASYINTAATDKAKARSDMDAAIAKGSSEESDHADRRYVKRTAGIKKAVNKLATEEADNLEEAPTEQSKTETSAETAKRLNKAIRNTVKRNKDKMDRMKDVDEEIEPIEESNKFKNYLKMRQREKDKKNKEQDSYEKKISSAREADRLKKPLFNKKPVDEGKSYKKLDVDGDYDDDRTYNKKNKYLERAKARREKNKKFEVEEDFSGIVVEHKDFGFGTVQNISEGYAEVVFEQGMKEIDINKLTVIEE